MCLARSHTPAVEKLLAGKAADQVRQPGIRLHEYERTFFTSSLNNPVDTVGTARNSVDRYGVSESTFCTSISNTKKQEKLIEATPNTAYVFEGVLILLCLGLLPEFTRKISDVLRIDFVAAKSGKQLLAAGSL